jgi:hypothetical protein
VLFGRSFTAALTSSVARVVGAAHSDDAGRSTRCWQPVAATKREGLVSP